MSGIAIALLVLDAFALTAIGRHRAGRGARGEQVPRRVAARDPFRSYVAAGAILVGYVTVEIRILDQPSWTWTEVFYVAVGTAIVALAVLSLAVAA